MPYWFSDGLRKISEMNREKLPVAFNYSQQDVQQFDCCSVHPLVMDHYAAQTRADSLLNFLQQVGQGKPGVLLLSGMKIDIDLKIRQIAGCFRLGTGASGDGREIKIDQGLKCVAAASVPRWGEDRLKLLFQQLFQSKPSFAKIGINVGFFPGWTELLLFTGLFVIVMHPAVLVPVPLCIVCFGQLLQGR